MIKTYQDALDRSPLSASTKRIYRSRVAGFLAWLVDADVEGDPLSDPFARDFAVRDYRTHLKETHHAPASVNAALAAVDHFYSVRGLGPANARREALPQAAPRALDPGDQRRFLRALEQTEGSRDRAIGLLGFYAGLRVAELAALNVDDVVLSARRGRVIVWHGKGDIYREVPLHPEARKGVTTWLKARQSEADALLLNRRGTRLSSRSVGGVVVKLGELAGIDGLTTHVLRHTFGTNLIRQGTDVVLVAELMGHRRLDTTRRYSLPTTADRVRAIEGLPVEG